MGFLALVSALLIEQVFPFYQQRPFGWRYFFRWAQAIKPRMNTGRVTEGILAVAGLLLPILLVAGAVYYVADAISPLLAWVWNTFVLYACMGFRQFSRYYTRIALALQAHREDEARMLLAEWTGQPLQLAGTSQIVSLSMAQAAWAGMRHVFGVLVWFMILPGPIGAVLYRLTDLTLQAWKQSPQSAFDDPITRLQYALDWVAVRIVGFTFAVVGNFEDTVHAWRNCPPVKNSVDRQRTLFLAATGGAIGVRLPASQNDGSMVEVGGDAMTDQRDLQSLVGLVWRALILLLGAILFITVVGRLGR